MASGATGQGQKPIDWSDARRDMERRFMALRLETPGHIVDDVRAGVLRYIDELEAEIKALRSGSPL